MTLILTAGCKDGIAVCADKRRTLKTAQQTSYHDDLTKVYRFAKTEVLAFNHGIHRIRGKSWDAYLNDFESSSVHKGMSFADLVTAFKSFIETPISQELASNPFDDAVGFVFCAFVEGSEPVIRELFWKRNVTFEDKTHRGLVRTGSGAHHLDEHLQATPNVNTVEHWEQLSVQEALTELQSLFQIACDCRKQQQSEEFSDSFDVYTLESQPDAPGDG